MAPAKPPFDPLPTEPPLWRLRNALKTPPPPAFHSFDPTRMIVAATAKPSRWSGDGSRQAAVAPSAVGTAALATAGRSGVARIAFKKGVRPRRLGRRRRPTFPGHLPRTSTAPISCGCRLPLQTMNRRTQLRYVSSVRFASCRYRITFRHGSTNRSLGSAPAPPGAGETGLRSRFP
jgi:hypothetical protein